MRAVLSRMLACVAFAALVAVPALACGPTGEAVQIPPPAAALDALLPESNLSMADMASVEGLRAQIKDALAAGNETAAREAEEQAMKILGFQKAWLACGPGTFMWLKS